MPKTKRKGKRLSAETRDAGVRLAYLSPLIKELNLKEAKQRVAQPAVDTAATDRRVRREFARSIAESCDGYGDKIEAYLAGYLAGIYDGTN
jgi:pimeloyl-CoA synthetase